MRDHPMSLNDDLTSLTNQGSDTRISGIPEAWRPRIEVDDNGGFFVSKPHKASEIIDAVDLFKDFNLDPTAWKVVNVKRSTWQRYDGEWLESKRISIIPAEQANKESQLDLEKLISEIQRWRPNARIKPSTGDLASVYAIGDTQYGKDAGDGSEGTIRRVLEGINESVIRHKELVKTGRAIGTVILPQLGDCIEGSTSQHGRVLGRSDLGVTAQVRLGRRMLMTWVKAFAPLSEQVVIPVVPGNHDEPHRIVITNPVDSWQIEVVSAVQDACAENDALAHVQFRYPESDSSTLAIKVGSSILGMAHGHQAKDLAKWWEGQAIGRTPVGDADVLLSGHYHHFVAKQVGHRLWIQVPAMDGGSPWYRDRRGLESPTGIVGFVMGDGYDPRRDLSVLAGENR